MSWNGGCGPRPTRSVLDIRSFASFVPEALMRPVPTDAVPFSTPRAWAQLARSLDRVEAQGFLTTETRRALAFGKVSAEDAAIYCAMAEEKISDLARDDLVHLPSQAAPRFDHGQCGLSSAASGRWLATAN